ncbi:hypothetical protein KIPE111705_21775 [Kibdelosporangium persicum]
MEATSQAVRLAAASHQDWVVAMMVMGATMPKAVQSVRRSRRLAIAVRVSTSSSTVGVGRMWRSRGQMITASMP